MGARKSDERHVRNITKNSSGTYSVTIPIDLIRELYWQRGQQVTIKLRGNKLVIQDWDG